MTRSTVMGQAPRIAYGEELAALAANNQRILALDGDLSKSTMSCLIEERFPERYFEMSIAEQSMVTTAAGMALMGKIPFVNSFAVFITGRAFDQIRQSVAYPRTNVKICGSSPGFSDFGDGATHQSIEDLAIMRALPNMTVLSPVDAIETREMVRYMALYEGPVYIRLSRGEMPLVLEEGYRFTPGEPVVIRPGNDVVVFATGIMVSIALEAADRLLEQDGIGVEVVNISTIKPMNHKAVVGLAERKLAVVTAEEHTICGGMGSAVGEALMETGLVMKSVGVRDVFGQSAKSYEELLTAYGLTAEAIRQAAKDVIDGMRKR